MTIYRKPTLRTGSRCRVNRDHASLQRLAVSDRIYYSQHETKDRISNEPILVDEKLGLGFLQLDATGRIKLPSKAHLAIRTKKLQDELEEEMRVFYVATTRAEKELILLDSIPVPKTMKPLYLYKHS